MNVLQDIKAKFFNGDGYLLKLAIFIIGCALMLLLIFALPLYGIISGRIYDIFFVLLLIMIRWAIKYFSLSPLRSVFMLFMLVLSF